MAKQTTKQTSAKVATKDVCEAIFSNNAAVIKQPVAESEKNAFEKKFGEGTAFDLDYGKLLIIALCIYIAIKVS